MKYGNEHFEEVAELFTQFGTVAEVQNHYPWASYSSVARWIRVCRQRGLLPPK